MAMTLGQLPAQLKTHLGILSGLQPSMPTPFYDIFKNAPIITGNVQTDKIVFNYLVRKEFAAGLRKKGLGSNAMRKVKDNAWIKVEIEPGEIADSQVLTASELSQLQAGQTEEFIIGTQTIKTNEQLAEMKFQLLKDSVMRRADIMCAQLINDGKVQFSNGIDEYDYLIPAADAEVYNSSSGFLVLIKKLIMNFRKRTGRLPNRVLIGTDIVDAILQDDILQKTMYTMGFNNIANNVVANNLGLVLGQFMGQNLEQMDFAFDEKGTEIIAGNVIKLIDTTQLRRGYAPIDVINPATNMPDKWMGDFWTGTHVESPIDARATLFVKSGFFPILVDPVAIQTANVTIS
jgi:hypothetical protein